MTLEEYNAKKAANAAALSDELKEARKVELDAGLAKLQPAKRDQLNSEWNVAKDNNKKEKKAATTTKPKKEVITFEVPRQQPKRRDEDSKGNTHTHTC